MAVDLPYGNPFQAPEAPVLEAPPETGDLRPVPWEDREAFPGLWKRLGGMFSLLFSRPLELADRVPVTEGILPAWTFHVLLVVPYLAFTALIMALMGTVSFFVTQEPAMPKGLMAGIFGAEFGFIAAFMAVGMFIYGTLIHVALWMWGATRQGRGLGQTLRFCGYAWGFVNLGMVIPCVNVFVALGGLVYLIAGLARLHRADLWRVICAILTPLFLCCLGYILFVALAVGLSAHT
ncbi:MAG TPA: hypothetical protein VFT46_08400 [Holophagaceae bacterium]|nr:hypothetical protein [Holophagaceae bacterium]